MMIYAAAILAFPSFYRMPKSRLILFASSTHYRI